MQRDIQKLVDFNKAYKSFLENAERIDKQYAKIISNAGYDYRNETGLIKEEWKKAGKLIIGTLIIEGTVAAAVFILKPILIGAAVGACVSAAIGAGAGYLTGGAEGAIDGFFYGSISGAITGAIGGLVAGPPPALGSAPKEVLKYMAKQSIADGVGEGLAGGTVGYMKGGTEGAVAGGASGLVSGTVTGLISGGISYKAQGLPQKIINKFKDGKVDTDINIDTKRVSNPKLKFNNVNEYYGHISDIGKRTDIANDEKLKLIQEAYEALGGKKGDVTCISDIKYITGFDFKTGRPIVDWPVKMGFTEEGIKGITRENPLPNKWDRIGAIGGENFTTLSSDGKIYSFDDRAIPYLENFQARHVGEFNNENYFDIIDAIADNDINKLNDIMAKTGMDEISNIEFKAITKDYNYFIGRVLDEVEDIDGKYGLKGNVESWKINDKIHMQGGAEQIVTPVKGNILERLGVLKVEF